MNVANIGIAIIAFLKKPTQRLWRLFVVCILVLLYIPLYIFILVTAVVIPELGGLQDLFLQTVTIIQYTAYAGFLMSYLSF